MEERSFFHSFLDYTECPLCPMQTLPHLQGDAVNAWSSQAEVIFDGPKETGHLSTWEAYSFHVMSH